MKHKARGDLNGFLDVGSHIRGELEFEDLFRVEGRLTGRAVSEGDLIVGENGSIDAEVEVGRIYIAGTVRGSIRAKERVEIARGGRVFASLETPTLVVEEGAMLQGHCTMSPEVAPARGDTERSVVTRLPLSKKS